MLDIALNRKLLSNKQILTALLFTPRKNIGISWKEYQHQNKILNTFLEHTSPIENATDALNHIDSHRYLKDSKSEHYTNNILSYLQKRHIITCFCNEYPSSWKEKLPNSYPPVLWANQPARIGPTVSIVGSRTIPANIVLHTRNVAESLAHNNISICSGGANGVDSVAENSYIKSRGKHFIKILPRGITQKDFNSSVPQNITILSPFPPNMPFTPWGAYLRNKLIYSTGNKSIVMHARPHTGGSWNGAKDALQYNLSKIYSFQSTENPAHHALIQIGAFPYRENLLNELLQ